MSQPLTEAIVMPVFDARARTLHLLPVLQADPFDHLRVEDISLTVSSSWVEGTLDPMGGIQIRQPYPNELYYVAGSRQCQVGWFVPLPDHLVNGQVTFHWSVTAGHLPPGKFEVHHQIKLSLAEGEGRTYSMDVANWWAHSEFAKQGNDRPEIGRNRFSRLRATGISPTRHASVVGQQQEAAFHLEIHESLSLPAIRLSECWTVRTSGGAGIQQLWEEMR